MGMGEMLTPMSITFRRYEALDVSINVELVR